MSQAQPQDNRMFQEMKKAAFRLEMNVRKEKYDKAVEQYNNLKKIFEENIGGM